MAEHATKKKSKENFLEGVRLASLPISLVTAEDKQLLILGCLVLFTSCTLIFFYMGEVKKGLR